MQMSIAVRFHAVEPPRSVDCSVRIETTHVVEVRVYDIDAILRVDSYAAEFVELLLAETSPPELIIIRAERLLLLVEFARLWRFENVSEIESLISDIDYAFGRDCYVDDFAAENSMAEFAEARVRFNIPYLHPAILSVRCKQQPRRSEGDAIGLIEIVAALNIFITLTMMVMEKHRDIAVLMSMGTRRRQVQAIFTLHGLLIGALGTLLGLGLGYLLAWVGDHYRLIPLDAQVYGLSSVPFRAHMLDGLWVALAAVVISLIATIYPAASAAQLDPVEILRYE